MGYRLDQLDDRVIRCDRCGQQALRVVHGPHLEGAPPPRFSVFYGTGWHRGSDGTYRLERHAKQRIRAGKRPRSAHPRVPTPGGNRVDHEQSPENGALLECGRCQTIAPVDYKLLRLAGRLFTRAG
jgi:hypothetical protein